MKIPIRSMLVAPKGYHLIELDLSQAESWVVAHLAESETMLDALYNKDIHTVTADYLFDLHGVPPTKDQRYIGKKFNHAKAYRTGPYKIVEFINKEQIITITIKEAKEYDKKWNELYNLSGWWTRIEDKMRGDRTITTIYRRKRTFYGPFGQELFKEATAFEPQSTVADHTIGAIQPEINKAGGLFGIYSDICCRGKDVKIVNTAHDSVVIEAPANISNEIADQAISLMKRPMLINGKTFTIPVDCKIGDRWGELEKYSKVA